VTSAACPLLLSGEAGQCAVCAKFPNFPRKESKNFTQYEQLIRDAREGFCAAFHWLAHRFRRGCFSHFRFPLRYAELRGFAAKGLSRRKQP
jgi:hypothetical protein